MGTYVVSDIHGCYDEWIELKNRIEAEDSNAKFILVGDIVDRGHKVMEMIDWAMKNITPGGKYQMVLGNHEDMKIEWSKQYNGIKETDFSKTQHYKEFNSDGYDFQDTLSVHGVTDDYVIKIIEFFKSLPLYIELSTKTFDREQPYIICHAAMPDICLDENGKVIKNMAESDVQRQYVIWDRNYFGNDWSYPTIVVHGHTPTCIKDLIVRFADPGKIDFRRKDINLDCGMCYNISVSNLAVIRLEDLQEFYVKETKDTEFSYVSRSQSNKEDMLHLLKTGKEEY